jgi:hypothetical protein
MMKPANSPMLFRVLGMLDGVKKTGSGWKAKCPAHEDREPSLGIDEGGDGRVLLFCRAGCETTQVVEALGVEWRDLMPETNGAYRWAIRERNGNVVAFHNRRPGKKIGWETPSGEAKAPRPIEDMPLYGVAFLEHAPPGAPVYVVEGEKAADALLSRGLLAVATYGTAHKPKPEHLEPLNGYEVRLWPDADEDGKGARHMQDIAERLADVKVARVRWVHWKDAPDKGDAADFGGSVADIVGLLVDTWPEAEPEKPKVELPRIYTASELQRVKFAPVRWAIPGLLPEGLTILAGRPKLGKSWLGLGMAVEVARGGLALDRVRVEQGEALYMALEDGDRRIQERLALILGDEPWPDGLYIVTEWPKLDFGGLDLLNDWLEDHPRCRYVGVDTFKRVRPRPNAKARLYDDDYEAMQPLAAMARSRAVAVMPVLHARKGEADDPLDMISGTTGLSGAADAAMVLRRERGQADASLFLTGRDVEERDLALKWHGQDAEAFRWELLGDADEFRMSAERARVTEVIIEAPGMRPSDIAGATGMKFGNVRRLLFKMVRDRQVRAKADNTYWPVVGKDFHTTSGNGGNADHIGTSGHSDPSQPPVTAVTPVTSVTAVTAVTAPGTKPPLTKEGADVKPPIKGARYCEDCGKPTNNPELSRCYRCRLEAGEITHPKTGKPIPPPSKTEKPEELPL